MTDQQKGYGLGIILGIRLPRLRGARVVRGSLHARPLWRPWWMRQSITRLGACAPASLSIRISPLHTYDEINLIKTLILFAFKTIYLSIAFCCNNHSRDNRTWSSVIFCASINGNRSVREWLSSKIYPE